MLSLDIIGLMLLGAGFLLMAWAVYGLHTRVTAIRKLLPETSITVSTTKQGSSDTIKGEPIKPRGGGILPAIKSAGEFSEAITNKVVELEKIVAALANHHGLKYPPTEKIIPEKHTIVWEKLRK